MLGETPVEAGSPQCARCGTTSNTKVGYCVCNEKSFWKQTDPSKTLPLYVEEPALWEVPLCAACMTQALAEDLDYSIKKYARSLVKWIIAVPAGFAVFLCAWFFATQVLGVQTGMDNPIVGIIFGIVYLTSLGVSLVGIVMLPVRLVNIVRARGQKAFPPSAESREGHLRALAGAGRSIIGSLTGVSSNPVFSHYLLPSVEYDNLSESVKKVIRNERTGQEYEILYPSESIEQLLGAVRAEWKEKLFPAGEMRPGLPSDR